MRNIVYILMSLVCVAVVACRKAERPDPNEVAARTAKLYYDNLVHGNAEAYVDAFYRPDSIPASYRSQLVDAAKMYVAQMAEDHGGLDSVGISGARTDTARHVGHAFLVLCFKDSVKEQIVVPMVLHGGNWMLK